VHAGVRKRPISAHKPNGMAENITPKAAGGALRRLLGGLGPGVITGAADDDPSGIATYSIAGAQLGTSLLWTALVTWPLMAIVQMMCARIGMVTGQGLAGALRAKFPKWALVIVALLLLAANTINVGADLAGMADAAEMLSGISSHYFVVLFGGGIGLATIFLPYHRIAGSLKWLTLSLFAYVITAFAVGVDWGSVLKAALTPSIPKGSAGWAMIVAILGTTISPYLFFWQASQEVEEEKFLGRQMLATRLGATRKELTDRRIDVGIGTFFSNLIMFFIILTTAATLHRHGITQIETSRQAAEALKPLAGRFAATLYTVGILGVGLLAIPTLTGSAAYALAETLGWKEGLNERFGDAKYFYGVVILSTLLGVCLDFANISPVRALFLTAVINGLLAPFLLIGILVAASDHELMQGQPASRLSRIVVGLTAFVMVAAAIGMFVF
jgi:NRAMP (natural resistance-associated macrophage protein)-like metal ion transporter